MRIVHLTDLHYHRRPHAAQLLSKRLLGAANLYLGGRARVFGGPARELLLADALNLAPDLVVITGDLSTLSTDAEFDAARAALEPVLDSTPTIVLAGNHDRYTLHAQRKRRLEGVFGAWMAGGRWNPLAGRWTATEGSPTPARFDLEEVTVLALDTARADLLSRGRMDAPQRDRLETALTAGDLDGRFTLLAMHYPLVTADGAPYAHPTHGLVGVEELYGLLRRCPVGAIVHGHVHHWFAAGLVCEDGRTTPVLNGGHPMPAPSAGGAGAAQAACGCLSLLRLPSPPGRPARSGRTPSTPCELASGGTRGAARHRPWGAFQATGGVSGLRRSRGPRTGAGSIPGSVRRS